MHQTDTENILVLSIKPEFAAKIFKGAKRTEFRRVRPRLTSGDIVLVYVSAPTMALWGAFTVDRVLEGSPNDLWHRLNQGAGIPRARFDQYFDGRDIGYAIGIDHARKFKRPLSLKSLKRIIPDFSPPQCYRYLNPTAVSSLMRYVGEMRI